ncbi:allophanate hydrolase subunit 2 [Planococcus antarcticus DSM 14505]|uniref:Allophanate hydrolase subunit 2 n=1 Tax=Planococcus antarcticus DSM 14505 TaxID=1185653 RepID=A0A1C7DCA9_9BACL|nr:biotin-dependent carboxyltransferase family protein [Planococcus antarcticus]ANU09139.1 KipI antagonist [Planococcus antarcticus DSM 14505]EIM08519.1 allophanate hydrolase subunit 2 [Planococcus antarcticus DSM 14505]
MLKMLKGGLQTTVQDLGRTGFQKYGVIASGAMDPFAHRLANLLVGNSEQAATLEITLVGPVIEFHEDALIALCGGDLSPKVDGDVVRTWRMLKVTKGSTLTFGKPRVGARCYLAIAGGIDVPKVMGSRSTYLRAGIGGFQGRSLEKGDELAVGQVTKQQQALQQKIENEFDWLLPPARYFEEPVIRMMPGRQFDLFDRDSKKRIFSKAFTVSSNSDRMGYRLEGSKLSLETPAELISEAVAFGSVQVPADGNPIVLLADRQTTGGYPKIGQIISVDLPLISQLKQGQRLRFKEISLADAQQRLIEQEQSIQKIGAAIQLKWEEWT